MVRRPLPPGKYSSYSFLLGYSAAGRIKSMKHSIDTIGNRTRDVSVCSAVCWGQTTRRFVFVGDLSLLYGYSPTARARSQASPYGITGGKISTGMGLSLRTPVSLTNIVVYVGMGLDLHQILYRQVLLVKDRTAFPWVVMLPPIILLSDKKDSKTI